MLHFRGILKGLIILSRSVVFLTNFYGVSLTGSCLKDIADPTKANMRELTKKNSKCFEK